MCRARENYIVIHVRYGFEGSPMEVFSFLSANVVEARVDVNQDRAFLASLGLVFLPAPFEGEASLEA